MITLGLPCPHFTQQLQRRLIFDTFGHHAQVQRFGHPHNGPDNRTTAGLVVSSKMNDLSIFKPLKRY